MLAIGVAGGSCAGAKAELGPFPEDGGTFDGGQGTGGSSSASGGSTGEGGSGSGGFTGFGGATFDGGSVGEGGTTASGGTTGAGGSFGAGGVTGSGGATGFGGSTGSGGSTGFGGTTGSGGSTGRGGSTGSGGSTGLGGSTGSGGSTGLGGSTGSGGLSGGAGTGGASFCPAGAIFCANFEEVAGVPDNDPIGIATFQDPTESGAAFGGTSGVMVFDTTAPHAGLQSLRVNPTSGVAARMLAVAVPATFWVRLYIKSDQAIGQANENWFFGAGTSQSPTAGNFVEVAEQNGCVVLDKGGTLYPTGSSCGTNTPLSANAWHCVVASFDGSTGNVQVFSGLNQIIGVTGWAPAKEAFNTFEFGYAADNPNGATVWYDDVVVSSGPLTCP
ncbi:MAG TPA: hypothetical protein VKZ18_09630 [Polyangia bacterium]|nr:hypothetical protein [Polyangia bacterium]